MKATARVGYIIFSEVFMSKKTYFRKEYAVRMEKESPYVKIDRKAREDAEYCAKHEQTYGEYPHKTVERWQQTMRRLNDDPAFGYYRQARKFYKIYLKKFRQYYADVKGLSAPYDGELPDFDYEPQYFSYSALPKRA